MRWVVALVAVLGALPAGAVSLVTEVTGARPFTAISLMGELELVKDRTFLTGCFSSMRSAPLEITGPGTDPETIDIPRSNQLCLGLDHGFDDHWRVSVMGSLTPRVTSQVEMLPRPTLIFRSRSSGAGATLGVAYDSAGLEEVQWGADLGVAANGYGFSHDWISVLRTIHYQSSLYSLRPSAGVLVAVGDTVVQLRAGYTFYSQDPLTAGAVSDDELARMDAYFQRLMDASKYFGLNEQYASALEASNRLMATDALSGLATAPVQLELRPTLQHRFARWLKGQVGYTYDRYVPGAGYAHVASTKWTVAFGDHVQTWAAASAQVDVPGTVPPQLYGILTLGVEVTF